MLPPRSLLARAPKAWGTTEGEEKAGNHGAVVTGTSQTAYNKQMT